MVENTGHMNLTSLSQLSLLSQFRTILGFMILLLGVNTGKLFTQQQLAGRIVSNLLSILSTTVQDPEHLLMVTRGGSTHLSRPAQAEQSLE